MPTHRGITITIVADETELEEHNFTVHGGRVATVYITGEAEQTFLYEYTNDLDNAVMIYPKFDGHEIESVYCAAGKQGYDQGLCISPTDLRPFKFSDRQLQFGNDSSQSLRAGVLEFRVCRVKNERFPSRVPHINDTRGREKVLADVVDISEDHPWESPPIAWDDIDTVENPLVIFIFLYQSRSQPDRILSPTPIAKAKKKRNGPARKKGTGRRQAVASAGGSVPVPQPDSNMTNRTLGTKDVTRGQQAGRPSNAEQPIRRDERDNNDPPAAREDTGAGTSSQSASNAKRARSVLGASDLDCDRTVDELRWELRKAEAAAAVAKADQKIIRLQAEIARRKRLHEIQRIKDEGAGDRRRGEESDADGIIDLTDD
ncbi:hypothetical protein WOLCODRAFT_167561 [Wolfiporia cocos MD-104 SS10]|uniref:Uncharacterized protein n=1 Tax=Wolfiporia cocos (strain MD-104) TaxID=742152 RepID=A0A2H3JCJ3_WOLCO|nr:hypothetical protein WOLCODRAFT_167561 [Wolfiporia cocos MD-104 SS10]